MSDDNADLSQPSTVIGQLEPDASANVAGALEALLMLAAVLGLSTMLRSRIGLWFSIALMAAPPILYLIGVVNQLRW